jgi:hypothetical protein
MNNNIEIKSDFITWANVKHPSVIDNLIYAASSGLLIGVLLDGLSWILGNEIPFTLVWIASVVCTVFVFLNATLKGKLLRIAEWMIFFWLEFIAVMFIIGGLGFIINYVLKYLHILSWT